MTNEADPDARVDAGDADSSAEHGDHPPDDHHPPHSHDHHLHVRFPPWWVIFLLALALLALLWFAPRIASWVGNLDLEQVRHPALVIFPFVVFDAVMPILPSESLLTTASNLAAETGSSIQLWRVILAGALGAVVGDSLLYWLSRTLLRRTMRSRLERAEQDPRVSSALQVFGDAAPFLIVFGRFVPGLRFVVGATMGLTRYPYPRFLMWDVIGGSLWSIYTCGFSYAVASVISDMPIVSIGVSAVVTTAFLAMLYRPIKSAFLRGREAEHAAEEAEHAAEDTGDSEAVHTVAAHEESGHSGADDADVAAATEPT